MRSVRIRILATLVVLAAAAVGGWQLLPENVNQSDRITVGTTDVVTSLDPAGAYDAGSVALFDNVFQSLMTIEPGGATPVPDAAEHCGFKGSELTTYVCTVRDGITFPSGHGMTAEDVKFSFDRIRRINSDVGPAPLFSTLKSVDADDMTVTFHLNSPDAVFPFRMATGAASIVDSTRYGSDSLRIDGRADGSGPYRLAKYDKDRRAVLDPNPRYEGAGGTGDPVEMRYFKSTEDLAQAWKSKSVDVAGRELPPKTLAGLSTTDPDYHLSEHDSLDSGNLVLNVRKGAPLAEPAARRAIALLIDRDKIVDKVYKGTTEPLYSLIPAGLSGHTTSFFDTYPQPSTERAKSVLKKAGVTTPVHITLGYRSGRTTSEQEATEIKKQLEASGLFEIYIRGYEWTDFQESYAAGRIDAYTLGWIADFPDADNFSAALVGTGNSTKNGFGDKRIDKLILESQQYADRSAAVKPLGEVQQLVAQNVPMIPLWQSKSYVVTSEDVGGGQYLSDGTGVFRLWRLSWL